MRERTGIGTRFAVETLHAVAPETKLRYLMVEFDPVVIRGNALRRLWVAQVERDGQLYYSEAAN